MPGKYIKCDRCDTTQDLECPASSPPSAREIVRLWGWYHDEGAKHLSGFSLCPHCWAHVAIALQVRRDKQRS